MDGPESDLHQRLERIEARVDDIANRLGQILDIGQWGHNLADVMVPHFERSLATMGVKSWLRSLTLAELRRRLNTTDLALAELKVFSQNGEDGVLVELLTSVDAGESYFVEFGASDGGEGNCAFLAKVLGWRGLLIEAEESTYNRLAARYANNERVKTLHSVVTPENVESLLLSAGVPLEPTVVSIDVDGADYWIWESLTRFRPRIIVIEYNSALDRGAPLVQPRTQGPWDGTDFFGASVAAFVALGRERGYRLVHAELTGTNLFFVREDLGLEWTEPILRSPDYLLEGYRHPSGDRAARYVVPPPPQARP